MYITYSCVTYFYHVVHYTLGHIYLITGSLYLLTAFIQFPLPLPLGAGNHKSNLFLTCFCFWNIIDLQHCLSFCYTTEWFDISIHFKMITTLNWITICHHTKILHNHWLYSLYCTFHTCDPFILQFEICNLLISLPYFFPSFTSSPLATTVCSLYLWLCFCFVLFAHLFCFLSRFHI